MDNPQKEPITFTNGKANIWWYLFALPLICLFCTLHFMLCSILTIFVYPKSRRYSFYEYYSPWGWGKRKEENEKEKEEAKESQEA